MLHKRRESTGATGFVIFDRRGRFLDANAAILGGLDVAPSSLKGRHRDEIFAIILSSLISFAGDPVEDATEFVHDAIGRWSDATALPIEAETRDGRWKLLTAHPRPSGGTVFISVDITEMKRAQFAFQESAEIFRCITDSHPLPVWVIDEETHEIYYESLDASRLLGRKWDADKPQYITGQYVSPQELAEITSRVKEEGIVRDHELRVTRKDGSVLWCSANFRRGLYRGRPSVIVGVVDITERKKREDLLAFLIEHHPLPMWMNDARTGEIIYQSNAAEKLFGWVRTAETAPRLRDYFVDDRCYRDLTRELFQSGEVQNYEALLKRADGQEFWAMGNALLVEFEGRLVTLSGIADVTRQKKRDAEITMAREMLANAVESLSEGFALYGEDQRLVMCNQRYREMYNHCEGIVTPGSHWSELLRCALKHGVFPDAIGREDEWLHERMRNGIQFTKDHEIDVGNGVWRSISIHPTDLGGFVVTCVDISERKKFEAAERDSNAVVHQVLDGCPSPTFMATVEGETLYRNAASIALYGARSNARDSYVRPQDRDTLVKLLLEYGKVDDYRVQQYTAEGKAFWASVSARLIEFRGRPVIVSNTTDISDLIAAQDQIRKANERLIDAIESLSEGFALYDKDDRLILANSKYREMNAISADVLYPGVNWFDFLRVGAERNQFVLEQDKIDDWLAERAKDRREYRQREFKQNDGRWFWVSNVPTRDGGFVVTRLDITERKRSELAEREADELVRRVLEACPVNIQMTRAHDGKLLYRSPAAAELHGDVDSAIDYYVNPEARKQYIESLFREGYVDDFETELRTKDGGVILCSISSRLIDFHGEDVIVSHTFDLTERIRMHEQLERQRESLHQNEKLSALGELLAGVAHELNNPLSVVLGQSLLLRDTTEDSKTRERTEKIINAADRCARIVKTFLAMARQEAMRAIDIAVGELLDSAIAVAGYSIHSSGIRLSIDIEPDLPIIRGDPDQLNQVFTNLLVNAEQALRDWEGKRKIKVAARQGPKPDMVSIRIADTGPGIPEDILPRIFEPFFTTKEVGAGTGIGLSFCHRIIQAHRGSISVKSKPGLGTAFTIELPVSRSTRRELNEPEVVDSTGRGLTCLLVEDEEEVGALIGEILRRDGVRVRLARSGAEALFHLKNRSYDFILSDLKMPNMDGRKLFKHITDNHAHMVEKLAFITGDTMSPAARNFLNSTNRPYLEKPIRPDDLRGLVARLTGNQ